MGSRVVHLPKHRDRRPTIERKQRTEWPVIWLTAKELYDEQKVREEKEDGEG